MAGNPMHLATELNRFWPREPNPCSTVRSKRLPAILYVRILKKKKTLPARLTARRGHAVRGVQKDAAKAELQQLINGCLAGRSDLRVLDAGCGGAAHIQLP